MSTEADIVDTAAKRIKEVAFSVSGKVLTADVSRAMAREALSAVAPLLRAERDAAARVSGAVAWLRNCHTEEDPAWVPCLKGDPGAIAFIATEGDSQ